MEHFIQYLDNIIVPFHYHAILGIGILLITGFFLGKLFEMVKLPVITGYILAGLILGKSVTGLINEEMGYSLSNITQVALSLIALTIGGEFSFTKIKRMGLTIFILTIFEALFAFIFVTSALSLFRVDIRIAFLLGSISAATAPAATVIIIRELRARGEFIDYLYGVVALDDAVCVLLFSVTFSIISLLLTGAAVNGGVIKGLMHALSELLLSILIGITGGFLIHLLTIKKYRINEIMLIALSIIFLVSASAIVFKLSLLIASMAMGATIVNLSPKNRRIFTIIEPLTPPVFALFFIIAGTELNISVFVDGTVLLFGLLYITSRFLGKLTGIILAGSITRVPKKIRRLLGFCLFPQAGVAIGLALFLQTSPLALTASAEVKELLSLIVNIVLFSVFINEFIGPAISRFGIKKGTGL